jgi:hypothetical protein
MLFALPFRNSRNCLKNLRNTLKMVGHYSCDYSIVLAQFWPRRCAPSPLCNASPEKIREKFRLCCICTFQLWDGTLVLPKQINRFTIKPHALSPIPDCPLNTHRAIHTNLCDDLHSCRPFPSSITRLYHVPVDVLM